MDSKIFREAALAYQAVYDEELRQEIEEQQDFENWVNSLVEEGYDLSEYTWEEMYEEYLSERGGAAGAAIAATQQRQRQAQAQGARQALQQGRTLGVAGNFGFQSGTRVKMDSAATRSQGRTVVTSTNTQNRGARGGTSQARPNTIQLGGQRMYAAQLGGKDVYVGARPSGGSRPAPAAPANRPAPAAPANRPAPAAPAARPAASAPTAKPSPTPSASAPAKPTPAPSTPAAKPSAMDQWAKANPRLAQAQQIRKQGGSRAEVNKALYNKGTAAATSTPTVVKAGFDLFDVVKGYLIDEGYAETEQAAIAIMANMSEGWKSEIINKVND